MGPSRDSDGTGYIVGATVVSAAGAYVFQVVGGQHLGPEGFAPIAILWTIQFLVVTIVFLPLEQLTLTRVALRQPLPRRLPWALSGLACTVGLLGYTARGPLFDGDRLFVLAAAGLTMSFGAFAVARGVLGGQRRFKAYGWLTASEPAVRLVVLGIGLAIGWKGGAFALAMVAAPFAAIGFLLTARVRAPASPPTRSSRRFLAEYVAGSAAGQTLLAGGPLALVMIGGSPAEVSVATVTLTLMRFPLTLAYHLMSRLLSARLDAASTQSSTTGAWLPVTMVATVAVAALVGAAAWSVGPPLVRVLFERSFDPPPLFVASAAAGIVVALGALVIQQEAVARDLTIISLQAWWSALVTGCLVLAVAPVDPLPRLGVALLVGELVAIVAFGRQLSRGAKNRHGATEPVLHASEPGAF